MKKLITAALTLSAAALVLQVVQWRETELPHAYCYDYGGAPVTCIGKAADGPAVTDTPAPTGSPTPRPVTPTHTQTQTPPPTIAPATAVPVALLNPSFENGAASWAVYNVSGNPEWNVESLAAGADPRAVLDGEKSLRFIIPGNYGAWRAGVFQRVRVGAGRVVTFSASAFFKAGTQNGLDENKIREIVSEFRVGIDPTGGQSAASAGIVWNATGGDWQWKTASVSAQAVGEYVTVFAEAAIGREWSWPWSMVFIDAAGLR